MEEYIENDLVRFEESIHGYETAYKKLLADYNRVIVLMDALNEMWAGEAHDALIRRFQGNKSKAEAILQYAEELRGDLQYANTEYAECEMKVDELIDSVRL